MALMGQDVFAAALRGWDLFGRRMIALENFIQFYLWAAKPPEKFRQIWFSSTRERKRERKSGIPMNCRVSGL